jgi:probable rRNA maturation factor
MKQRSDHPSSQCHVDVLNRQREVSFKADKDAVVKIVQAVLENECEEANCVNIHFLSDTAMRQYHKRFFHDSSATDCMSFPLDEDTNEGEIRHLGDVFVCPMTALRYANNTEDPFWKEITLYIVHGVLHLLGYDDVDPASRSLMRRRERSAFSFLKKQGIRLCGTFSGSIPRAV